MTQEEKIKKFRIVLFVFAVLTILLVSWYFKRTDQQNRNSNAAINNVPEDKIVPVIVVREDSLINLLTKFYEMRNIPESIARSSGDKFHVLVKKFSGNPVEFFNNPKLPLVKGQGFSIEVKPTGDIEADFKRARYSVDYYVEIPTDILFRLLKGNYNQ